MKKILALRSAQNLMMSIKKYGIKPTQYTEVPSNCDLKEFICAKDNKG